jgi:predicted permease
VRRLRARLARVAGLFGRARRDRDFEQELQSHLELHIDDNVRRGMSAADARRAALVALGGLDQTRELERDVRTSPLFDGLVQDVRYGARALGRNPGFALVAAGTLAVGIGAATAVFSLFNAVIIRSLPYRDANRLVYVNVSNSRMTGLPAAVGPSNADFLDLERTSRSFSSMAAINASPFTLVVGGVPERIKGARVSGDFFRTLDVVAQSGRVLTRDDDRAGRAHVAVISDHFWRSRFHASDDAVGRPITLDRQAYRVVGIMPPAFEYPRSSDLGLDAPGTPEVWVPFALTPSESAERDLPNSDALIARLRTGVSEAQARAEIDASFPALDALHSREWRGWRASVVPFLSVGPSHLGRTMWLLLGAISLVLLIACSNAAHLILARAAGRAHEVGVRAALGATRGRIIRQLVTEALLVSGIGGAAGVSLAAAALTVLPTLDPGNIPRFDETSIDWRVLAFSVAASLFAGLLAGLLPALALSRVNTVDLLKRGGAGRATDASRRPREILIVTEVALACLLLVSASLFIRSYVKVLDVDRGFSPSTLTMRISLDDRYARPEKRRNFFVGLLSEIRTSPDVEAVGAVSALPLSHSETVSLVTPEGHTTDKSRFIATRQVTAGYFRAMGTPLVAGRALDDADADPRPPAVVVNQAFVRAYFRNENAVGKRVCLCVVVSGDGDRLNWPTIVGVVGDVRHTNLEDAPSPEVYSSFLQGEPNDSLYVAVAVRAQTGAAALLEKIREMVKARDPGLAVADARLMNDRAVESSASRRFQTLLLGAFSAVALVLAGVGLYGLLAYSARRRAPEFAIRMALGAGRWDILGLVAAESLRLMLIGLAAGLAASLAATRLFAALLFGITPLDPLAFGVVPALLLSTAMVASWLPARRATRVDPVAALRAD